MATGCGYALCFCLKLRPATVAFHGKHRTLVFVSRNKNGCCHVTGPPKLNDIGGGMLRNPRVRDDLLCVLSSKKRREQAERLVIHAPMLRDLHSYQHDANEASRA